MACRATQGGIDVGSPVRVLSGFCLIYLFLYLMDHYRFDIRIPGLPFNLADYAFVLLGVLGLLAVPPSRRTPPILWKPLLCVGVGWAIATLFAVDANQAGRVTGARWVFLFAAFGIARLGADPIMRRMVIVLCGVLWLRWVLYVAFAYVPGSDYLTESGVEGRNKIGIYINSGGVLFFALGFYTKKYWWRVLGTAALFVSLAAAVASYGRSTFVFAILGALLVVLHGRTLNRKLAGAVILAAGLALIYQFTASPVIESQSLQVSTRFDPRAVEYQTATTVRRRALLVKAAALAVEYPTFLVGIGHNSFAAKEPYEGDHREARGFVPHNTFVGLLVEGGFMAFCAWMFLMWLTFWRVWRGQVPVDTTTLALAFGGLTILLNMLTLDYHENHFLTFFAMTYGGMYAARPLPGWSRAAVRRGPGTPQPVAFLQSRVLPHA